MIEPTPVTESVYNLVGIRRGVAKVGHKWSNFGCAAAAGRPSGVLPMKNRLRCREQARRVYYGAVFEIKKEIPDPICILARRSP
jgi:hypothetical protein